MGKAAEAFRRWHGVYSALPTRLALGPIGGPVRVGKGGPQIGALTCLSLIEPGRNSAAPPLQINSLERESIRRNSLSLQMAVHGALAFAREKMMFKRNMGSKERVARMVFGALLICTGVVAMHSSALGIAVVAVGGVSLITGIFSYCPACAVAGREPTASSR